ncbi:MAG: hypothetical protein AUK21_03905 [Parcubacteria group bacterium CG2_30_48_51]|nr:MAG: hypothetical protein AUK21_03905 [Parcubacteria group bacterium CG2_30_48_51]
MEKGSMRMENILQKTEKVMRLRNYSAKTIPLNDTTMYTDKGKSYDGLVLDGYKPKKINHPKTIIIAKARM